ncbi:hypothetical protein K488DRAFT_90264 [Vararia minispora EC-137]|uniref:Uncharacterized protein n=1 Tax=Vararia minispora EC-137 TaxID=1314806 RepID=A0ACB8Q841_9AGAM|nr:hypothetical protein K488DRAFT_90264 [Vararia minispora EC-137]
MARQDKLPSTKESCPVFTVLAVLVPQLELTEEYSQQLEVAIARGILNLEIQCDEDCRERGGSSGTRGSRYPRRCDTSVHSALTDVHCKQDIPRSITAVTPYPIHVLAHSS